MERRIRFVTSQHSDAISRYTVQVLGPFSVWRNDVALETGSWPRRSQTLLKLLVTAHQGRRLRDEVIDILWPDAEPKAGASNLRYVLHALRRDLGGGDPPPITSNREWIGLNDRYAWEIDLRHFEALAAQADVDVRALEEAMTLYRGELLVEDRYEDWTLPLREHVERTRRMLGIRLAREYHSRGLYQESIRWTERLLECDPVDEEAMQALLQTLEAMDLPAEAVRRYREFERRLADELGVAPSDETRAVVVRVAAPVEDSISGLIGGQEDTTPRPTPTGRFLGALPPGPIIARKDDLARLDAVAEAVASGNGRFIVLVGEPGTGKTRLAQEAMVRLRDGGYLVLTGRCSSRAGMIAYHPLVEILTQAHASLSEAGKHRLGEVAAGLERQLSQRVEGTPRIDVLHAAREVRDLLSGLAEECPVALLMDDLHWADEQTLHVLHHLASSTRGHRVLLLATYREVGLARDHPLLQTIREVDREGLVERLAVRRLTEDGTAALVAATVGELDADKDFAEFVHRRTKGNPFYIDKLLRAIGGRYRLVRQIGAGGMGRVFEAVDTQMGDSVAAKIMFARTEADPKALLRFEQEGTVLASLGHPNIVQVRDVFLEERASCIVMELLRGQSLGQILQAERPNLTRVKHLAGQVAAALVCAHERGIVHRDIKPDNIMVLEDDHVKVTDFGIARLLRPTDAVTTLTSTGMAMGTPLYMAPEQIEGKVIDGRVDIYALGCVLYQMVTGRPPFEGDDPLIVAIKHVRETPRPPRELNPHLPKDWEALILKALAKEPADRFAGAAAMERALAARSDGSARPRVYSPRLGPIHTIPGRIVAVVAAIALILSVVAYRTRSSSNSGAPTLGRMVASWSLPTSPASFKHPTALAVDGQGRFFVLDRGANRIVRLSQSGIPLGWWGELGSGPGQLRDPQALALDGAANVYVADTGNDRVEKFSPTGQLRAVWGRTGSGLGQFRAPDGIAVDPRGFIYVADAGNNRVEVLNPSGQPESTSVSAFTTLYAGLSRPAGIAVNSRGEAYVADNGDNSIVHYSPDGLTSFGSGTTAVDPRGVALDTRGNVYVTDASTSEVQLFSTSLVPSRVWRIGGTGVGSFSHPQGVAIDAHGVAYLADSGNGRILKLSRSGQWLPAWSTSEPVQAPSPASLALDGDGNLYVADIANSRVLVLSASGRWLRGRDLRSGFVGPAGGIAVDGRGDLLVTDYGGNHVVWLSGTGRLLGEWGANPSGPGLTNPQGITVDRDGNVYVADQGNNRIQEYSPEGQVRAVWPLAGRAGADPYLYGVTVDGQGSIYVTDELNARVLRLSPSGHVTARWGTAGSGPGQLRAPEGLAVDNRSGRVYVADTDNKRIQVFSSMGTYLDSSPAQFVRPVGVAVDGQGNIYVTDAGSRRIEKFSS